MEQFATMLASLLIISLAVIALVFFWVVRQANGKDINFKMQGYGVKIDLSTESYRDGP